MISARGPLNKKPQPFREPAGAKLGTEFASAGSWRLPAHTFKLSPA